MKAIIQTTRSDQTAKAIVLMLIGCGLLTANDALMKSLVTSLPVTQILGLRGVFALLVVLLLAPAVGGFAKLRAKRVRDVAICSGLLVLNIFIFPFSLPYLPLADAIILAYTSPIWVVALAPLLIGETSNWQQWVAVLIGFLGACLVIKPGSDVHWAVLLPLAVAVMVGLRDIVTRKIANRESALAIVAYTNVMAIAIGALFAPFSWAQVNPAEWMKIALAGALFSTSQIIMVEAFRHVEATVLSTFKYSSILFAAAFGYFFWGELLDIFVLLGALLITMAGVIIVRYRHRPVPTLAAVLPRDARKTD